MANAYGYLSGGADYVCFAAAEGLRERGHEVAFLSTRSERNVVDEGVFVDQRVTQFNRDQLGPAARARAAAGALWNRDAARGMEEAIRDFRPDVVQAHKLYPQLSVAPLVVARRRDVPIVQSLYDYELLAASSQDDTGGRLDRNETRLSYRALNTTTFVIRRRIHVPAVSAWVAGSRFLRDRYRLVGIEAEVLPWFVERPAGEPEGFDQRSGVTFIGRLSEEKGLRDVLEVASSHPELEITIAGEGPLVSLVESTADRLPNLTFAGHLPHERARELAGHARVALMPSRWQEPGALAALEAMAAGTPVVAYANGGLAEYVGDADGGPLIEPDAGLLARTCAGLYEDRPRWERHSSAAIGATRETHTRDAYVTRLAEILERVRASG